MSILGKLHGASIHRRRIRVLAEHLAGLLPAGTRNVLDVGCGDGRLAFAIQRLRPEAAIHGVDVLVRSDAVIPVGAFDGKTLPVENETFDVVMFADVLHHTEAPLVLLREAARVTRRGILIKDHFCQGLFGRVTLSFMDWVGNASHGVALPYNYWTPEQWQAAFQTLGVQPVSWLTKLGLYSFPFSLVFERSLHFIALLQIRNECPQAIH